MDGHRAQACHHHWDDYNHVRCLHGAYRSQHRRILRKLPQNAQVEFRCRHRSLVYNKAIPSSNQRECGRPSCLRVRLQPHRSSCCQMPSSRGGPTYCGGSTRSYVSYLASLSWQQEVRHYSQSGLALFIPIIYPSFTHSRGHHRCTAECSPHGNSATHSVIPVGFGHELPHTGHKRHHDRPCDMPREVG